MQSKKNIYFTYNYKRPKILQILTPENSLLQKKSCAQIEADIYFESNRKMQNILRYIAPKEYNKKEILSAEEIEYYNWKNQQSSFASKNIPSLIDIVDKYLSDYGINVLCYNKEARWSLRCESYFNLITLGVGAGKTALSIAAGIKLEKELVLFNNGKNLTSLSRPGLLKLSICEPMPCRFTSLTFDSRLHQHIQPHLKLNNSQIDYQKVVIEYFNNNPNLSKKKIEYLLKKEKDFQDFDKNPTPFRHTETTLFPEGINPDDVLNSFSTQKAKLVEEKISSVTYQTEFKGTKYEIIVCKVGPCIREGMTYPEGEILSFYPKCGPSII